MARRVVMVTLAGLMAWWFLRPADNSEMLFNHIWLEHIPYGDRDEVHYLVVTRKENRGAFMRASDYRSLTETFEYDRADNVLDITMQQTLKRGLAYYQVTRCAKEPFDLCLEITGAPQGPAKYYSGAAWEVDSLAEARELLERKQ